MAGSTVRGVAPTSGQPEFYASSSGTKERKEAYIVDWYRVDIGMSEEEKREIADRAIDVVSKVVWKVREIGEILDSYSELITCLEVKIKNGWIWLAVPVSRYFNPIIYWEDESSGNVGENSWRIELAEVEILERGEEDA